MFFFFKQKTAYEMRISDWSSDVCSSDLGEALRERGAHRLGAIAIVIGTGTHRKPVVARGEALEPAIAVDHPPGENVAELAIIEHQVEIKIGRASGRERVCQYV